MCVCVCLCLCGPSPTFQPHFGPSGGNERDRSPSGSVRLVWWGRWSVPDTGDSLRSAEPVYAASSPGTNTVTEHVTAVQHILFLPVYSKQLLCCTLRCALALRYDSFIQVIVILLILEAFSVLTMWTMYYIMWRYFRTEQNPLGWGQKHFQRQKDRKTPRM